VLIDGREVLQGNGHGAALLAIKRASEGRQRVGVILAML
jgi:hypothetical protein